MRFNRLCSTFALPSALLLLLSCSRSDVLTDAGGSVVVGADPAQTRGFARVTLDSAALREFVEEASSLPKERNPELGTYMGDMRIGINKEGDTLAAHAQYRVTKSAYADSADTTAELVAAFIHFPPKDAADNITLFLSDTLGELAPIKQAYGDSIGGFSLRGAGATDSVMLPDTIAERIFKAMIDTSAGVENVAFSFVSRTEKDTIRNLDKPYIVVTFKQKRAGENEDGDEEGGHSVKDSVTITRDTIRASSVRYTVFENAAEAVERAKRPYSSQLTRRTAAFKINLKTVLDTLGKKGLPIEGCVVMNAVIAVKSASMPVDNYLALVSDTPLPQNNLRDAFKGVDPTGAGTHDFKPAMRDVIDEYIRRRSVSIPYTPYIYVYLRPDADGSVIEWDKDGHGPQKIETVFTNSR